MCAPHRRAWCIGAAGRGGAGLVCGDDQCGVPQRCDLPFSTIQRHWFIPLIRLQLTSLGLLLGFSYVRSRNLLTPILIHGAWNGGVLTLLYVLASQGIDIQELIHAT